MIQDATNASLMLSVNTSLLKKSMDTSENLMATILEGAGANLQSPTSNAPVDTTQTPTQSTRALDIYA